MKKLIIHGGVFHADDALCVALAKYEYPDVEIVRTFKIAEEDINDPDVVICDIGGFYDPEKGLLDHHNFCPLIAGTEVKMSAIGMLINYMGIEVSDSWNSILTTIQGLDNGMMVENISEFGQKVSRLVRFWNPTWDSEKSSDEAFNEVVQFLTDNFVKPMMEESDPEAVAVDNKLNELSSLSEAAELRAEQIVKSALQKMEDKIVVLPIYAPWQKVLVDSEAIFVVFPSVRGGYNLQCVPPVLNSFQKKVELPDWNCSEEKPEGLTFEHAGRFIAAFQTEQQAINAAKSCF